MKTKIYVITHKEYDLLNDEVYAPLLVGACFHDNNYGYLKDDVGENISEKNPYYSELTGLYWIWKNSDADIIGLMHYRRYLTDGFLGAGNYLKESQIKNDLKKSDIIVFKKRKLGTSVYNTFRVFISSKDFEIIRNAMEKVHPDYVDTFNKVLCGKKVYSHSIFISSRKFVDDYSGWLFPFLEEVEKHIDASQYEGIQKRLYGFIGEFCMDTFIVHNNLKTKEYYMNSLESKSNILFNILSNSHILWYCSYWIYLGLNKI